MKKIITIVFISSLTIVNAQKILFDATKGEMAGNADWVIDADLHNVTVTSSGTQILGGTQSNPQRIPTPAQSGITANTSETYWNGALSYWAIDLVRNGYTVESLPYNGKITYGDGTNAQDLSNYKVFIVDEPNIRFTVAEQNAMVNFVKNGGGLFMISDHTISDRNNDGWDSPAIWNDFFTSNTVQKNPFGITFDLANFSQTSTNFANLPNNTILHGTAGNPNQLVFTNGTSMTLSTANNSSVQGLFYKNGSSTTGTTGAMVATATYGTGKVVALGDSSVPDDGTGDTGDTLYNGYTGDGNGSHRPLLVNATIWLATSSALGVNDFAKNNEIFVYPNPTVDFIQIKSAENAIYKVSVSDALGRTLINGNLTSKIDLSSFDAGVYFVTVENGNESRTFKVIRN